ncbi:MAG: TGS domain-containing protein [Nitrososphaerota archaeon]|nr:TGS domain-containing protein [Nitrososphaerota archaeon]
MPTNLPAEARQKLAEYQAARDIETKMRVLQEAISLIPDHKGTEKLRRQLRKRLSELRRELEERRSKKTGGKDLFLVQKEEWALITLLGPANSGKSSLFNAITGANSPVADYQLTTTKPYVGVMSYEGADVQMVDLPPILTDDLEETSVASRCIGVARNSDLMAVVLDSTRDPTAQFEAVIDLLEDYGISIRKRRCDVEIKVTDSGGVRLIVEGRLSCSYSDVRELLNESRIRSAIVKIRGEAGLEDIEEQLIHQRTYKKGIVILNKIDSGSHEAVEGLTRRAREFGLGVIKASSFDNGSILGVKEVLFHELDVSRIYTQKDGEVSPKPILIRSGSTVRELAELIHKELAERMKYARVWGRSVRVQGERVGPDHVLVDMDVVEIKA